MGGLGLPSTKTMRSLWGEGTGLLTLCLSWAYPGIDLPEAHVHNMLVEIQTVPFKKEQGSLVKTCENPANELARPGSVAPMHGDC